jgi:hypothetical protein
MVKTKTKAKRRAEPAARGGSSNLVRADAPRSERRFSPDGGAMSVVPILASSGGSLLLGAGVFGQWLRTIPHPYAVHMLVVGGVLLAVGLFLGTRARPPIRVGDAGVAVERSDDELERIGWNEVQAVRFSSGVLTFTGPSKLVTIDVTSYPGAAAMALREARARIPLRARGIDEKLESSDVGEVVPLEAFQAAGLRCKASDRLLSLERDARLCARCGEVYHKDEVPERCVSCDAELG